MRFVFDTNVIVSALLFEQSRPAQAFFCALQQEELLLSTDLVNEISRVINREKFDRYVSQEQRDQFLIALVQTGTLIEITEAIHVCRDPKDNMILELAVSGQANAIVSGDDDLLMLNPFRGIPILSPTAFLDTFLD
ncbi:MAG: putative toxin-antitoxin system toxin component, PIN family [Nanoarchaeota archaeon]|nr:putative toxin-antitoxin system toxin component, PIN family [Nanoarchaeota archaeon]